jgi:leader peptidase (prepilin peptidase)/N-methyltransferase
MAPWWVVVALGAAFAGVGLVTGRRLATGDYRIEGDEVDGPPGSVWWVAPATGVLAGLAAWAIGDLAGWAALPAYLLFAWLTVALVWIDLDVHRLPYGLVLPGGAAILALLVVASVADGGGRWRSALVGAVACWVVYLVLWILPGGMGGGDLRLAPVLGALLGWLGYPQVLVGLMAGFLIGGVAALGLLVSRRAGPKTAIAYGPAMCLGAWVGIAGTSRILTALLGG